LEQLQPTYRGQLAGEMVLPTMGAAALGRPDVERGAHAMGETILALRSHAHMSQLALGERVSMHTNYIGAIERGEIWNPGLETVDRIAEGLGVSVAVLAESYATAAERLTLRVDTTGGRPRRVAAPYDAQALGAAIRLVRRQLDLTQQQLADESGLHRNHIGSIETGEKATRRIATIARVAHGLTAHLGGKVPSLLPLLVQVFTGEATPAHVRDAVAPMTSGPPAARSPQASADN
jgi:transcriptional regulator with XRE-family HTH domain